MSRTDKTRPYQVKARDHLIARPRLEHDPEQYSWRTHEWWHPEMRCGCPRCQDRDGRKAKTRRERYDGRRECRKDIEDL